jgi:hypothetical protein
VSDSSNQRLLELALALKLKLMLDHQSLRELNSSTAKGIVVLAERAVVRNQ